MECLEYHCWEAGKLKRVQMLPILESVLVALVLKRDRGVMLVEVWVLIRWTLSTEITKIFWMMAEVVLMKREQMIPVEVWLTTLCMLTTQTTWMKPTYRLAAVIMPTRLKWRHFGLLLVGIMPRWTLMQPAGAMYSLFQQKDIHWGAIYQGKLQKMERVVLVMQVVPPEVLLARERVAPQWRQVVHLLKVILFTEVGFGKATVEGQLKVAAWVGAMQALQVAHLLLMLGPPHPLQQRQPAGA
jgi:hypothetical protein